MITNSNKNTEYVKKWKEKNQADFGYFYMITNSATGDRFVGFTILPVKQKLWSFISLSRNGNMHKVCVQIRQYGVDKFRVEIIYNCKEEDNLELKRKELCLRVKPTLNAKIY